VPCFRLPLLSLQHSRCSLLSVRPTPTATQVTPEMLEGLGLGGDVVTPSRASGVYNLLEGMRKRARQLTPGGAACGEVFPSLTITADAITPQGAFAEAQATYLQPDPKMVQALVKVLTEKKVRAALPVWRLR
jgi:quinolinate synthase